MSNYLLARAGDILKQDGILSLLKRATIYSAGRLFRCGTFLLYENSVIPRDEELFHPRIKEYVFKVISTDSQVDDLVREGFQDIRKAPVIVDVTKCLDNGAIACCFFVGTELAHINWIALTGKAKNSFDIIPYAVNFSAKQACVGGTVTVAKYEGNGFMQYGHYQRLEYLRQRGYTTTRNAVAINNEASQRVYSKFSPKIYAKGYYVQILHWQIWRERKPAGTQKGVK